MSQNLSIMENQIELGKEIAQQLIDDIIDFDSERILYDKTDKFCQGRCVIISGPSDFSETAKGKGIGMIYICLDAGAWGTLTIFDNIEKAKDTAEEIINNLEEN